MSHNALLAIFMLALSLLSTVAAAEEKNSLEYAKLGRTTWSAFECSILSLNSGKSDERKRLFNIGMNSGKSFLYAIKNNKIKKSDIDQNVPVGVLANLDGPSDDFILGVIWKSIGTHIYDNNANDCPLCWNNEKLNKIWYENAYTNKNCALIK